MPWYCVHTMPHLEHRATTAIRQAGFRVLLPTVMKTRRHAGRTQIIEAPYFNRYLFAYVPERQSWGPVRWAHGVSRIISDGEVPRITPERVISELLATFSAGPLPEKTADDWLAGLARNTPLRVVRGPLEDREGPFAGLTPDGRALIMLDIMGRYMPVGVPREHVTVVAVRSA